jgi:3-deoxy-manno-octulosonate cytidylyltransferase (CMP-KDO synthetase)
LIFKVYIPARYASTRLPGKLLLEVAGRPIIEHVYRRCSDSGAQEVVIATDDERIADVARELGATVCMTPPALPSGTDRIADAVRQRQEAPETIIVNVQGDEPQMPAAVIRQVAECVADGGCDIATVCEPLAEADVFDPNVVKVVRDNRARALYFSRASIPWERDNFARGSTVSELDSYRRHVGIYAYRVAFLGRFVAMPMADLERIEALEQLRALAHGAVIDVPDAAQVCGIGVDTAADLARLRAS